MPPQAGETNVDGEVIVGEEQLILQEEVMVLEEPMALTFPRFIQKHIDIAEVYSADTKKLLVDRPWVSSCKPTTVQNEKFVDTIINGMDMVAQVCIQNFAASETLLIVFLQNQEEALIGFEYTIKDAESGSTPIARMGCLGPHEIHRRGIRAKVKPLIERYEWKTKELKARSDILAGLQVLRRLNVNPFGEKIELQT